jgi:hypothetical protein
MSMTVTDKVKKIRPMIGFGRIPDVDLLKRLDAICDGLTGNPLYPSPPVDLATFKAAIETYSALITDALDGGKKAISARRKQREVAVKMAMQLGHYVAAACNDDLATFTTSGFLPASNLRTPPQPLPPATIKWVDRGHISGQLLVKVTGIPRAVAYDVRYAVISPGGTFGPWTTVTLPSPKASAFNNLTSGTTYAFQVRALGKLGYTDWSDSTIFMCA